MGLFSFFKKSKPVKRKKLDKKAQVQIKEQVGYAFLRELGHNKGLQRTVKRDCPTLYRSLLALGFKPF